jgi:nicotinate-nucleotide adenylyltransferase
MCRLATVGHPGFDVSDLEIQREGVSFTVDTVRRLEELHPDWDLHMILGSDSLAALDTWKDPAGLLEKVTLVVYPRHGDEKTAERLEATQARGFLLDAPLLAISASDVRGRLARGQSVRYLIPDRVLSYVEDHALYR